MSIHLDIDGQRLGDILLRAGNVLYGAAERVRQSAFVRDPVGMLVGWKLVDIGVRGRMMFTDIRRPWSKKDATASSGCAQDERTAFGFEPLVAPDPADDASSDDQDTP